MVEIVRQALIDLLELLRNRGLRAPRLLGLQFDNCGENKNKEMFGYISVLIEDFIFDVIEVLDSNLLYINFLFTIYFYFRFVF